MNKTVVFIVSILSTMCIVALLIWGVFNRYSTTQGPGNAVFVVDKLTGKSWFLKLDKKVELLDEKVELGEQAIQEIQIPKDQLTDLTGTASLYYTKDRYLVDLYNGTGWIIRSITITITAKNEDGSIRWQRDFQETVDIEPFSVHSYLIRLTQIEGIKDFSWYIKSAQGYLSTNNKPSLIDLEYSNKLR
jgi:hypothetical protein